jgi:hypothetical protein
MPLEVAIEVAEVDRLSAREATEVMEPEVAASDGAVVAVLLELNKGEVSNNPGSRLMGQSNILEGIVLVEGCPVDEEVPRPSNNEEPDEGRREVALAGSVSTEVEMMLVDRDSGAFQPNS